MMFMRLKHREDASVSSTPVTSPPFPPPPPPPTAAPFRRSMSPHTTSVSCTQFYAGAARSRLSRKESIDDGTSFVRRAATRAQTAQQNTSTPANDPVCSNQRGRSTRYITGCVRRDVGRGNCKVPHAACSISEASSLVRPRNEVRWADEWEPPSCVKWSPVDHFKRQCSTCAACTYTAPVGSA